MFNDDVIFSHAHTLTGCPYANNVSMFRAYIRLICCYPPHMSRETWMGMSMSFSSSMKIFLSYVPGMYVVVFTRSSVARALASTPICCSMLEYTKKDQAKRRRVSHRSTGACGAFFSPRVFVLKCMHKSRWWCDSRGNMNFVCDIFYQVPHASTRGLLL